LAVVVVLVQEIHTQQVQAVLVVGVLAAEVRVQVRELQGKETLVVLGKFLHQIIQAVAEVGLVQAVKVPLEEQLQALEALDYLLIHLGVRQHLLVKMLAELIGTLAVGAAMGVRQALEAMEAEVQVQVQMAQQILAVAQVAITMLAVQE
jgi:hypothetical protein